MKIYRLLLLLSSWAHRLTALNVAILLTCLIAVALVGYAVYLCRKEEKCLKLAACLMLWIGALSFCAFETHTFPALDTNNSFTGSNTFLGPATSACRFENTRYVDSANSCGWSGATPDAWVVSAIADCPSTGCVINATGFTGALAFAAGVSYPSSKPLWIQLENAVSISGPCPLFDLTNAVNGSALTGGGNGDVAFATPNFTNLKCTSGTDGVKAGPSTGALYGIRVENLSVNCNGIAARGFTFDTVQSSWIHDLNVANCTGVGAEMKSTSVSANTNFQWNSIDRLAIINTPVCMQWDNNTAKTSNVTQNTFTMLKCSFTGAAGININGADNNWFYGASFFRNSGVGVPIACNKTDANNFGCISNHFYGILGGVAAVASINFDCGTVENTVNGYDFNNGEAPPTACSSAPTSYIFEGQHMSGSGTPPSPSGIDPGYSHWLYAEQDCGNPPNGNPTLPAGVGICRNFSNGLGEGDFFNNVGGGSGAGGLFRFYSWNGSTATLFATLPNSPIGTIVGTQAVADQTALGANVGTTQLVAGASVAGGLYRVSCYTVVTRAATTSSTLPNCALFFADNDTAVTENPSIGVVNSANTLGANSTGSIVIDVRGGQTINYLTNGYVSSGATTMQYAVHVRIEYLGS